MPDLVPAHLPIFTFTHLPIYPFTHLPICPFIHLPICPFAHLPTNQLKMRSQKIHFQPTAPPPCIRSSDKNRLQKIHSAAAGIKIAKNPLWTVDYNSLWIIIRLCIRTLLRVILSVSCLQIYILSDKMISIIFKNILSKHSLLSIWYQLNLCVCFSTRYILVRYVQSSWDMGQNIHFWRFEIILQYQNTIIP